MYNTSALTLTLRPTHVVVCTILQYRCPKAKAKQLGSWGLAPHQVPLCYWRTPLFSLTLLHCLIHCHSQIGPSLHFSFQMILLSLLLLHCQMLLSSLFYLTCLIQHHYQNRQDQRQLDSSLLLLENTITCVILLYITKCNGLWKCEHWEKNQIANRWIRKRKKFPNNRCNSVVEYLPSKHKVLRFYSQHQKHTNRYTDWQSVYTFSAALPRKEWLNDKDITNVSKYQWPPFRLWDHRKLCAWQNGHPFRAVQPSI